MLKLFSLRSRDPRARCARIMSIQAAALRARLDAMKRLGMQARPVPHRLTHATSLLAAP